jgi:hypothetical protein
MEAETLYLAVPKRKGLPLLGSTTVSQAVLECMDGILAINQALALAQPH